MNFNTTTKQSTPVTTAKKHWTVYVTPVLLSLTGTALLTESDVTVKIAGAILTICSVIYIMMKASVKWHLTNEHLVVKSGFGPGKKEQQIHLYEIYESTASLNKMQRMFDSGTIRTRRREETIHFKHTNISNAQEFTRHLNILLEKHPANDLNKIFELKEKGIISENEYNVMKLGYIAQHHLT